MGYGNGSLQVHGRGLGAYNKPPTICISISVSDVWRSGDTIACNVTASLNAMGRGSYFGYNVNVYAQLDGGGLAQIISKPNSPKTWSSGTYSTGTQTITSVNGGTGCTLNIYFSSICGCHGGAPALCVQSIGMSCPPAITYYNIGYDANGGSNAPGAQTKASNANLTLTTAQPTPPNCVVTYNANGGSVSPASASFVRPFAWWNTAPDGSGASYSPGAQFGTNANTTLYAIYYNATISGLPTPTRASHDFLGWRYANGAGVANGHQIATSQTITAAWIRWYIVSYNGNGGGGVPANQKKYQDTTLGLSAARPSTAKQVKVTFNPNGGSVSPTSVTKVCSFLRWNTAANGSGANYAPGAHYTANAAATMYAVWSAITVGELPIPGRSNCNFVGWYTAVNGGTRIKSDTPFYNTTTIYARWDYHIMYDLQGGFIGDENNMETSIPDTLKQHNVNVALTRIIVKKAGLSFAGWSTSPGGPVAYGPGGLYTTDAPCTLYAVFQAATFTVTFDLKGGSASGSLRQSVPYGGNAVLPSNPTQAGKTFKGWLGNYTNVTKDEVVVALWNGSPLWRKHQDGTWHKLVE